ncbi:MAG: hypothetical protein GEV10_06380 [Streptosporangiales bacterium]|nr:hypothetical protein [Streptosporangiales bacterium]
MATKTSPDLAAQTAEAERQAANLRALLEEEEAERQRVEAERQAQRERLAGQWWRERRSTFSDRNRGRVDTAWAAFKVAVRDGGDTLAAWREYRVAVREVADDRVTIDRHFDELDRRAVTARREHFKRVGEEAHLLSMLQVPRDISRQEYNTRLAAWRTDAEAYRDEPINDTEFQRFRLALARLLPAPPVEWHGRPSASKEGEAARRGRTASYAEAVDLAMAEVEDAAVQAAALQRDHDRTQWVDQHLAPQ